MLHGVCSTIVHGEHGLSELPRKSSLLNPAHERWTRNLVKCLTHGVIPQAYRGRVLVSTLMMIVLVVWERLARRSPWSAPIAAILLTIRREVKFGWSSFSSFMAQAPFQVINLPLHGYGILLLRNMVFSSRLALTGMGCICASLLFPFSFKLTEVILMLRPHRLCLVWTWSYHRSVLDSQ